MNPNVFQAFLQTISSIIVILSTIIAGIWVYYKFKKLRSVKEALTVAVIPTIHKADGYNLVEVVIELTNTGTIPIFVRYTDQF